MSPISSMRSMSSLRNTTASDAVTALVSLGSNLSGSDRSPQEIVLAAMESLRRVSIEARSSSLYRSAPIDCPPDVQDFINAAMQLRLSAAITAHELLRITQGIEADFGRRRPAQRNQARTLDIDIISFENQELESADLVLPHPRAARRRFVLLPLAEIDPNMRLPGQSENVAGLLAGLATDDVVRLLA